VSVRQLISGDMMIISHEITEMKSAIDALCALHSVSIPKIASSLISKQVEKRELQSSTLLTELGKAGVAVPHARFPQLPTRLSVALGLFPNGLFWRKGDEEEDRLVRVVFLCLVDSDYPNTYLDYLSKLARIFRTFKGLDEQIVSAKSVDDVLEIIGDSELSCDSGSL
jgi:mannitol/fructose-specific phosphotransferase system IIA component (Ntr-type)